MSGETWAEILFGGMISAIIAAGVAVVVVRSQVAADDRRERRREDARIAVATQRAAVAFGYAWVEALGTETREARDAAILDLWSTASEAATARPKDEDFRNAVAVFQNGLIDRVDALWKSRGDPRRKAEREALVPWVNEQAQAIASYLESGEPLRPGG